MGRQTTHARGRWTAGLTAVAVLAAGIGMAVVDTRRHQASVHATVTRGAQTRADTLSDQLTQLSRESRTLAAASRTRSFDDATADVADRNPAVLGALVLDDFAITRVAVADLPGALLERAGIDEGVTLAPDELDPAIRSALDAVLDGGELRLAGPIDLSPVPLQVTLLADRAPAIDGRPDQRLLLLLLDVSRMVAVLDSIEDTLPLATAVRLDGGVEGVEDLGTEVIQGDGSLFTSGEIASSAVAGVRFDVAARPAGGWPRTSPATPLIVLPSLVGAALAFLVLRRRQTEQARLRARVQVATANLRRARAREQATVDHSPDGLLDVHHGVVTSANAAAGELLGRDREEIVGMRLSALLPHSGAPDPGTDTEVEVDGRILVVRAATIPVEGEQDRLVVTLHDVTDDRRSSELLRHHTRRLEELNAQYAEVESVRNDLVAKVSHEIRTPLTVIGGVTELLARPDLSPEQSTELLAALHRQLDRLAEQVDGLLQLAESSSSSDEIADEPTSLSRVATGVSADLALDCVVVGDGAARISGDGAARILRALLSNAMKYGQPPIEVRVHTENGHVHCDVVDQGSGIEANGADPFTPFAQGTSGDRRTSHGLGVGLTMARGLARATGGDVTIRSYAQPTILRLTLPSRGRDPEGTPESA